MTPREAERLIDASERWAAEFKEKNGRYPNKDDLADPDSDLVDIILEAAGEPPLHVIVDPKTTRIVQ